MPISAQVEPRDVTLTGATFAFCFEGYNNLRYCFAADLAAKTLSRTSPRVDGNSPAFVVGGRDQFGHPKGASLDRSADGKGLTACTADKATCHDLPIDAANLEKPIAVSDDATLVAIDTSTTPKTPGTMETWDAVTGKKLASFEMHYGRDGLGFDHGPTPGTLAFLGHTVLAYTMPCTQPCSTATMYSVRGEYLGELASEASSASADHFHDDLYVLHSIFGPFVVQDAATGQSVQPDADTNWDAVVSPDRIVRVVGPSQISDPPQGPPRVEVWGPDLKRVTVIPVPACP